MSLTTTALPAPPALGSTGAAVPEAATAPRWAWLPAPGSWRYHALLVGLGVFVLGPLGGVTAAYM
ncbi:MAG: hypothetical protein KGL50_01715, partial [Burkholderiales bacterium]|nr:hypothetical protein [Burkholderiales bacterium]